MAVVTGPSAHPEVVVAVPPALRAELFTAEAWDRLTARPAAVLDAHSDRRALARLLPAARVLVTSWGAPRVDAELLDAAPRLGLVAHTGGAVAPYVAPEVFARGVRVTQAGEAMARPVAEVALAFTLALLHRLPRYDRALRSGAGWEEASAAPPRHEILGCPVGVVGASRTGRAYVALVRALGAEVAVCDPYLDAEGARRLGVRRCGLPELLRTSRIVALHAPATPETRGMIGVRELALLPDGAGLVNTARSWLVDEAALVAEAASGRIDAAVDVFDAEPLPVGHPLRALPNVLLTPHRAAATVEGRRRLGDSAVRDVERFLAGAEPLGVVGPAALERVE